MSQDWKSFRREASGGCACGEQAELHMMFVPKLAIALLAVPVIGIAKGGGDYAYVAFAAFGSMLALLGAVYAHLLCTRCYKIARPEGGKERSTLGLFRIACLLAAVVLAGVTWYAATHVGRPGAALVVPTRP